MIDGASASASELLASALKEQYGAKLVGTKSFGKSTVQQVVDLNNVLYIFPQGIIKPPNARPIEFRTGLAYIAQNAVKEHGGINLCPVAVNYPFLREDKPEIIVDIGEPITFFEIKM